MLTSDSICAKNVYIIQTGIAITDYQRRYHEKKAWYFFYFLLYYSDKVLKV